MQSQCAWEKLPTEVLEQIIAPLSQRELTKVAVLSRRSLDPARERLYLSLHLSNILPNIALTLKLLNERPNLSRKIRSATITTQDRQRASSAPEPPWITSKIFEAWTRLEVLRFEGFPFKRATDRRRFESVVKNECPSLASISFVPSPDMDLVGILDISWVDPLMKLEIKLTPAKMFDIHAVTHLSVGGTVIYTHGNPLDLLLRHHFPNLISLDLGSLAESDNLGPANEVVTQFLSRHSSIQHVSLGTEMKTPGISFQLHEPSLTHNFLPQLRSFFGFPEHIAALAQNQDHSLKNLEGLSLVSNDEELQDMTNMLAVLNSRGVRLLHVQRLHVELFPNELNLQTPTNQTLLSQKTLMFELAEVCPIATDIFAKLPPINGATILEAYFGNFRNLESLSLPHLSLSLNMPEGPGRRLDYLRPISNRCPSLRKITARQPEVAQKPSSVFLLDRDGAGRLFRVTLQNT